MSPNITGSFETLSMKVAQYKYLDVITAVKLQGEI